MKIKAKYVGEWDPEFRPGEIYNIHELKDNFGGKVIAAENKHGEAYVMPRALFEPIVEMKLKVRYIGEDAAEIRKGEIYEAEELVDCKTMYGVKDRSGENYAYPKQLFEVVQD